MSPGEPRACRGGQAHDGEDDEEPTPNHARDPNLNEAPRSTRRSPSKLVLPKRRGLPQNRCYQERHRKGGRPVTERGRREYTERVRQRYQLADKRERGRLLDEYCRVTECHRKAAIRRLRARE